MNKRAGIVLPVLEKIHELTPFEGAWSKDRESFQLIDAGGKVLGEFPVMVFSSLTQARLASLLAAQKKNRRLVVIAGKIPAGIRSQLRELEIGYLDGAGNAFLEAGQLVIFVEGKKDYPPFAKEKRQLFSKSGILLIFHLLNTAEAESSQYRELAGALDLSLGTVGQVMKMLQKAGFLIKLGKTGWKLHQKKALLDRWITAYAEHLKPGLLIGRYRFASNDFYEKWPELTLPPGVQWGGEPAADLLTRYLRPGEWTVYFSQDPIAVIKSLRLVPEKEGDVLVYQRFWKDRPGGESLPTVPALLVYCDLIASGNGRNIETAQMIWDEQFKGQF